MGSIQNIPTINTCFVGREAGTTHIYRRGRFGCSVLRWQNALYLAPHFSSPTAPILLEVAIVHGYVLHEADGLHGVAFLFLNVPKTPSQPT